MSKHQDVNISSVWSDRQYKIQVVEIFVNPTNITYVRFKVLESKNPSISIGKTYVNSFSSFLSRWALIEDGSSEYIL